MPEIRVSLSSEMWAKLQAIRELGKRKPSGEPEVTEDEAIAWAITAFWNLRAERGKLRKKLTKKGK